MATNGIDLVRESYIQWARKAFDEFEKDYEKFDQYYAGDHSLAFATDKWKDAFGSTFEEFSDNWCQVIVDSVAQRMKILGWDCEDDKEAVDAAEAIWDESHVDQEEMDLYPQTFIKGDGYLMVWPNPEEPELIDFFFNDAAEVNVFYSTENKRRLVRGAKRWINEDGELRLNIYLRDVIEQYIVPKETNPLITNGVVAVPEILPSGWERMDDIANPYGEVPVFHFKNKTAGYTHGISELKVVIPIQNAVNKMLMDMMLASEFGAFPQKWMAGGGHPAEGWKTGPNRLWATTDPSAKFGAFDAADLEPYSRALETLVGHLAKVTQTPMHYLRASGDMPSGEALKTAESSLVAKARDRQRRWGHTWSHAMSFAVKIRLGREPKAPVYPVWDDPETRHDLEQAQTAQLKSILGVPIEKLWSEHFGYSEEEIAEFKEMNKSVAAQALAQLVAQSGQMAPGLAEEAGLVDVPGLDKLFAAGASGDVAGVLQSLAGMDPAQILALLPKGVTAESTAGEATVKPQPNTSPPASPTRRSRGFKD